MAVRSSMAALISRVRTLINDKSSAQFADQDVQDYLDRHRITVRYVPLDPRPTYQAGGVVWYTDYYADVGDWEADEQLVDTGWNVIVPATSDELTGHWTFTTAPPGQQPPVRITGKTYDVWAAAADLLEQWATAVALQFAFSVDGNSYQLQQQRQALLEIAGSYRMKQKPKFVYAGQSDQNEGQNTPGPRWLDDYQGPR